MTNPEKVEFIADTYGLSKQLPILAEECCELAQAALKLVRYPRSFPSKDHLYEELADVKIMVAQIEYLIGSENIFTRMEEKLDRQIRRIERNANKMPGWKSDNQSG